MNIRLRNLAITFAPFTLAILTGCNSDPNRKVESAEQEHVETHAEYQEKANELNQKQVEQQADLEKKQAQERADLRGEYGQDMAGAHKDVVQADANMTAERQAFYSKAKERLDKVDARAEAASTKLRGTVNAKSRSEATAEMTTFQNRRDVAAQKVRGVPTVSNEMWTQAKKDIENALDEAEKSIDRVEKKL